MAEKTRICTVEITRIYKNEDGMLSPEDFKYHLEAVLENYLHVEHIHVAKIQDFVFPNQPKVKLTKGERAFCELIGSGYIVRDKNCDLTWHEKKPKKSMDCGVWYQFDGKHIDLELFNEIPFMFITWEDEEPWAVEALLMLEVEE